MENKHDGHQTLECFHDPTLWYSTPDPSILCSIIYRWPGAFAMRCKMVSGVHPLRHIKYHLSLIQAWCAVHHATASYLRSAGDDLCSMVAALINTCFAVKLDDCPVTANTPASVRLDAAKDCKSCRFEPKPYSNKLNPCLQHTVLIVQLMCTTSQITW